MFRSLEAPAKRLVSLGETPRRRRCVCGHRRKDHEGDAAKCRVGWPGPRCGCVAFLDGRVRS